VAKAKAKFEKLQINLSRGGELRFETAYDAREAARIATKWARKGWAVKVNSMTGRTPFMTCEPSARKAYWSDPDPKAHAICKLTPAFKKRVRGR
jgi:hypothetical protein